MLAGGVGHGELNQSIKGRPKKETSLFFLEVITTELVWVEHQSHH